MTLQYVEVMYSILGVLFTVMVILRTIMAGIKITIQTS